MDIYQEIYLYKSGTSFEFSVGDDDSGCSFEGLVMSKKNKNCEITFIFHDWCENTYQTWEGRMKIVEGKVKEYWIDYGDIDDFSSFIIKKIFTDVHINDIKYSMNSSPIKKNYKKNDGQMFQNIFD